MNPELEKYIDMALFDGVITENEKSFLLKKANELGVEKDEFDFLLNYKIQIKEKESQESTSVNHITEQPTKKTQKEGVIKKCPACGAHVQSFTTNCIECGHEFRNVEVNFSASAIFEKFKNIEEEVKDEYFKNNKNDGLGSQALIDSQIGMAINERKINFISAFPIPNTREDILEILALGVPEAKIKLSFFERLDLTKKRLKNAWHAKCEQIIMKARIAMKEDKKTLEQIETYAKDLGI